jgi:hypothetical protein
MKKLILGTVAALALTLGIAAPQASAAWATRPVTSWDARCGRYVTTTQTYWVPDPVVCVDPVQVGLNVVGDAGRFFGVHAHGRVEYRHGERGRHEEHREYHHR